MLQSEPRIHENTITQGDILLLKDVEAAEKELSASPEQDQSLIEDNEVVSQRRSKRSKTSSKERSSSSDSQALAALLIEEPLNSLQLAVTGVEQTDMVMKEKKLDKRSSATRKSLSRRVKRLAPQGDIAAFLKPPTSQEESIASPENEIEDLSRDEQRASKVVQSLEKYLSQFIDTSYCTKTSLVLNWPLYCVFVFVLVLLYCHGFLCRCGLVSYQVTLAHIMITDRLLYVIHKIEASQLNKLHHFCIRKREALI